MTQCEEQVDYQLPKELTRVNLLLDTTKCKDPGLKTDIVIVKGKKGPNVKTNKSEDTKSYITPWEPGAKNHNTNRKRGAPEISDASGEGSQVSSTGANK